MIPFLTHLKDTLSDYDTLICDVWGVLHDGVRVYPHVNETLQTYRAQGGRVVLLSNSPGTSANVAHVLKDKGVARDAWDVMVTSGDLTRFEITRRKLSAVYHIGTARDLPTFNGLNVQRVALEDAQALVVTGLVDDVNETAEHYRPILEKALERGLALICANPDLIVHVGSDLYPCAGAIAALYEEMGGEVYWAGKPHKPAYDRAFEAASKLWNKPHPDLKILAIGDAIRTDIAGAHGAGLPAILITQGIHRDDFHDGDDTHVPINQSRLMALTTPFHKTLIGVAAQLRW